MVGLVVVDISRLREQLGISKSPVSSMVYHGLDLFNAMFCHRSRIFPFRALFAVVFVCFPRLVLERLFEQKFYGLHNALLAIQEHVVIL
jgi:hypothetical protein